MRALSGTADRHDAAVAAAHAASHHWFERDEHVALCPGAEPRDGAHHRRRAAGVHHERLSGRIAGKLAFERHGDAASLAAAAVLRRQHEPGAESLEELAVIEIG